MSVIYVRLLIVRSLFRRDNLDRKHVKPRRNDESETFKIVKAYFENQISAELNALQTMKKGENEKLGNWKLIFRRVFHARRGSVFNHL